MARLTGSGSGFVDGLRVLRFPTLFIHTLDQTLGLMGGLSRPGGRRGAPADAARSDEKPGSAGFFAALKRIVKGDVGFFTQAVRDSLSRAKERVSQERLGRLNDRAAHDVGVLTGIVLVMATLKMLKVLPGVPFAPGYKTLLFFPLYILASRLTYTRWGGTVVGAVMGVIGLLQGDGRFGVLEVLKPLAPGFVIDLAMPAVQRLPERAWVYCTLGLLAALARVATEFALVFLLGARGEVYLFPAAKLVPTLIAGTLSGFVTVFVLKASIADPQAGEPPGSVKPLELVKTGPPEESTARER